MTVLAHELPNSVGPGGMLPTDQSNLSAISVVEAAYRHRRQWLYIFGAVMLLAIVITLMTTKQYESEMNIIVQNARGTLVITPERSTGSSTVSGVTEEQVNSEIEVLRSKEIAEAAIDPQWNVAADHTAAQFKAHDKLVEKFRKNLSVELIRKSNVIHIAYSAKSPTEAQDTLKRLLAAFLAKQREIELPSGAGKFFASQALDYKNQLEKAQRDLASYQQKGGIVSLPEKEAMVDKQVADLESDLRSTDLQLTEAEHRLSASEQQLQTVPKRQNTVQRSLPYQNSVEQLNTMLAQLSNKREELLTKYLPTDRLAIENQRQIDSTTAALARLNEAKSQEQSTDVNPVWQQMSSAVALNSTEANALRAKRASLSQQIATSKAQLSSVEGMTVEFSALKRKVAELENNYQLYSQKRDEAQMADAMDQQKLLNVAVAELPTIAYIPIRPRPVMDLALGGFTAIFLACCAVFFTEMSRSTLSNARELEAESRYPVLATVPLSGPGIAAMREPSGSPVTGNAGYSSTRWERSTPAYDGGVRRAAGFSEDSVKEQA